MHGDKRGSGSECVSEGRRGEREEEEGEGEEEEGGGERGPLNANKTLKAYLQYVIPTAQLGFSLWQDQQQKVTAPALLPVTEIRITVFVCAGETHTASVCLCRFAFHSHFFPDSSGCHDPHVMFFSQKPWRWFILFSHLHPIQLFFFFFFFLENKKWVPWGAEDIHYQLECPIEICFFFSND